MATYPLDTLAPVIDATGIHIPSYEDVLLSLQASFRQIYGSDAYLEEDSQDGQLLAIFARAIHESNLAAVSVFNSFSPATAQGVGLSNVVKINGLKRLVPSPSTAIVTIIGQTGTLIENGVVEDTDGRQWDLPASVTIPIGGEIQVTATAKVSGAISAQANSITRIVTPIAGWQTVTNDDPAVIGAPVETDATLRRRQSYSTSIAAVAVVDGIVAELANLSGVQQIAYIDNDTDSTDGNGIPSHSIAFVVEGGDADEIAEVIARKKTPGTGTFGDIIKTVVDSKGVPATIRFSEPDQVPISIGITIQALNGYVSTTGLLIRQALVDYINALPIGADVYRTKLFVPASLPEHINTYNITILQIARDGGALGNSDLVLTFDELATCVIGDVALTVV